MIERYSTPEMDAIWSEWHRYELWLQIELAAMQAWGNSTLAVDWTSAGGHGHDRRMGQFIDECKEREAIVQHDVAAFVDVGERYFGSYFHYGLTSSDVVDTALFLQMRDSAKLLEEALADIYRLLRGQQDRAWGLGTRLAGRTHGQQAEPILWADKLWLWGQAIERDWRRLQRTRMIELSVGKLAGPVGNFSTEGLRDVEIKVLDGMGLAHTDGSQVIGRDRVARYVMDLAGVGATMESISLQIRLLSQTEIAEVQEGRGPEAKGSSSMPHKYNPIKSEQLAGIARMLRGWVGPALESVALWGERDISHSSVERVMLPDISHLTHYGMRSLYSILENLQINPTRMSANVLQLDSHQALERAVDNGESRDAAYRGLQAT